MSNIKTPAHQKTKDEPGASVDEQTDDSFPASDPPSYNAGGRVGQPHRDQPPQEQAPQDQAPRDQAPRDKDNRSKEKSPATK